METKYKPKHQHLFISKACKCGKCNWGIARYVTAAGHHKYPWYCRQCGKKSNIYEPNHPHLIFTYVFNESEENACEKCGAFGAELHHWAPKHLFGEVEADKWPQSYLCQPCHATWHNTVTPNMNEGTNS